MSTTHREFCRLAAGWLMQQRWCVVAGYEVQGPAGILDAVGASRPDDQVLRDLEVAERRDQEEVWHRRINEWRAARTVARRDGLDIPRHPGSPGCRCGRIAASPRAKEQITIVEVKRTRSDLLADLRAGKMVRYEPWATRCYLAATGEALRADRGEAAVLTDLQSRGLPTSWGVLQIYGSELFALRTASRLRDPKPGETRLWAYRIGRSLAYRITSWGLMAEEVREAT